MKHLLNMTHSLQTWVAEHYWTEPLSPYQRVSESKDSCAAVHIQVTLDSLMQRLFLCWIKLPNYTQVKLKAKWP